MATGKKSSRNKADDSSDVLQGLGSDKLYFKIGEVAEIVGVQPHVLRYWETEFSAVRPQKSRSKQRVYRRKDVETILKIKHLLYDKKFTIAGARQHLREAPDACEPADPDRGYLARRSLERVKVALADLGRVVATDLDELAADPAAGVIRPRLSARDPHS